MKKKISIAVITMIGAIVLGLGIYQSNASQGAPKLSTDEIRQMVLDQYPGEIEEIELETDFNRAVYEVEVVSDGKEYDLKLDGNTGEVLNLKEKSVKNQEKEKIALEENNDKQNTNDRQDDDVKHENNDRHHHHHNQHHHDNKDDNKGKKEAKQKSSKQASKENKRTVIDSSEAISIAKDAFSGKVVKFELDEDDGRLIYEIELESDREEAEIEIDAYTGEIIVIEIDLD